MIWFEETEGRLQATLSVELELVGEDGRVIWQHSQSYGLGMTDDSIPKAKKYQITIPFDLERGLERLHPGGNKLYITLTNRADGSTRKKTMDFNI
jgi:hypothetical protein